MLPGFNCFNNRAGGVHTLGIACGFWSTTGGAKWLGDLSPLVDPANGTRLRPRAQWEMQVRVANDGEYPTKIEFGRNFGTDGTNKEAKLVITLPTGGYVGKTNEWVDVVAVIDTTAQMGSTTHIWWDLDYAEIYCSKPVLGRVGTAQLAAIKHSAISRSATWLSVCQRLGFLRRPKLSSRALRRSNKQRRTLWPPHNNRWSVSMKKPSRQPWPLKKAIVAEQEKVAALQDEISKLKKSVCWEKEKRRA